MSREDETRGEHAPQAGPHAAKPGAPSNSQAPSGSQAQAGQATAEQGAQEGQAPGQGAPADSQPPSGSQAQAGPATAEPGAQADSQPQEGQAPGQGAQQEASVGAERARAYWRANLKLTTLLLSAWFTGSYLLGILLVEPLNAFRIGGFPLGFWFAQQGSIYIFILLIVIYAIAMDRLARRFGGA